MRQKLLSAIKTVHYKTPRKTKIWIGVFVSLIIIGIFSPKSPAEEKKINAAIGLFQSPEQALKQRHQKWVEDQFSRWDGSHSLTVRAIKESMNNPNSFDHVKTSYTDNFDMGLVVFTTFRGKNVFGGIITKRVVSKIDTAGNITSIKYE
jgi:hypothetical protein